MTVPPAPDHPPRPAAWCAKVAAALDPAGLLRQHGARIAASARIGLRPQVCGVATGQPARLIVEDEAVLEPDIVLDLSGTVRIGARARVGTMAMLLSEGNAIDVGAGAVIGARAVVRGEARIVDAAVVLPCSQVTGHHPGAVTSAPDAASAPEQLIGGRA